MENAFRFSVEFAENAFRFSAAFGWTAKNGLHFLAEFFYPVYNK